MIRSLAIQNILKLRGGFSDYQAYVTAAEKFNPGMKGEFDFYTPPEYQDAVNLNIRMYLFFMRYETGIEPGRSAGMANPYNQSMYLLFSTAVPIAFTSENTRYGIQGFGYDTSQYGFQVFNALPELQQDEQETVTKRVSVARK